jgi:hypothetical protein
MKICYNYWQLIFELAAEVAVDLFLTNIYEGGVP